jgi:hypothetical protein
MSAIVPPVTDVADQIEGREKSTSHHRTAHRSREYAGATYGPNGPPAASFGILPDRTCL